MSSRNPNSGTSGSSSPSPSPNSGENRENIVPQREEIQADETVPKEEEQSAADTADSASKLKEISEQENPDEKIPQEEDPEEEIPKQENADEEMPQAENPVEEISKQENPDEEMPQEEDPEEENPEPEIPQQENPKQEIPEQENPHEVIPLEGDALFAYLSGIVPDIEMDVQKQIIGDIEARNRQQVQIANQAQDQVPEAVPISCYWSDNLQDFGFISEDNETFEQENAELDAMYAENLANEPNREGGNRGQEDPTIDSIHSIPIFEPNRGAGITGPENPTIANIFREPENPSSGDILREPEPNRGIGNRERENPTTVASIPPIEPNRGNENPDPENPTLAEMAAALPQVRRIRIRMGQNPTTNVTFDSRPENPTIDSTFDSRPAINPNRGFTIRDPQNPTNNPVPAAVPEQHDKGKGKGKEEDENPRPTKICKCISESCFLFAGSTSEEQDDIITLTFVSAYRRNQGPLPSAESPEHFDALFAFITSQLPQGESISLETLKEKLANLLKKYSRLLRQRDVSLNFETLATNYERDLYQLGGEVWDNANAQGYRSPGGNVGTRTSGASGDGS